MTKGVLCRPEVSERLLVKATQPDVVGNEEGQARRLNDVRTPQHKPDECEEEKSGQCHSKERRRQRGQRSGGVSLRQSQNLCQQSSGDVRTTTIHHADATYAAAAAISRPN